MMHCTLEWGTTRALNKHPNHNTLKVCTLYNPLPDIVIAVVMPSWPQPSLTQHLENCHHERPIWWRQRRRDG